MTLNAHYSETALSVITAKRYFIQALCFSFIYEKEICIRCQATF